MAWRTEDRRHDPPKAEQPYLTDDLKSELEANYLPRYPTRRAALLPALHMLQHRYGWIPPAAVQEAAEFLQIAPAEALDTATFYEEYWLRPKGKYLLQVCRSLACEICGSRRLTDHLRQKLRIEPGETTADGRFTLVELECLGSCGTAPAMLCNDVLHEDLTVEQLDKLLAELPDDPAQYHDPAVDWETAH
jgi:NADH-quinone oxidoreductase E subunit